MKQEERAASGYRLEGVFMVEARYRYLVQKGERTEDGERPLEFLWDWRMHSDRQFEVVFGARVGATTKMPDEFKGVMAARFELLGEAQTVGLQRFVRVHAPTLLTPYLRELLSNLSGRGRYGPYYLPPINLQVLSEEFEYSLSTGAMQLEQESLPLGGAN